MAQNYNARDNEVLFQHVLLSEPVTIPAGGSASFRIVSIVKLNDLEANEQQEGN